MNDRVLVFDTTLRDGEQAPGCSLTPPEKLDVARQLARLGVDIIEAGFPASSQGDWDAVNVVASLVGTDGGPVICGLARANERDIERCATALQPAVRRRIHTFIATSDLHIERKLRKTRGDVLAIVPAMVAYARTFCDDVEFSPEDASRSDQGFLYEVLSAALEAGATTLNIPDTVGYAMPEEYHALIAGVLDRVVGSSNVVVSAHCHDDLGMAVANSLAAVRAGARQVECTINGLGERAGNAALEEIVMALVTRSESFGVTTRVRTTELSRTSQLVAERTHVAVPPNKAIVGANAFAHEAGIHQDGMLKHRATYEIMRAESVGVAGSRMVLGKHSGRNAVRRGLERISGGVPLDDAALTTAFARFKEIADGKKSLDDGDLEELMGVRGAPAPSPRTLFEKIWNAHVVRPETTDAPAVLYVDLQLIHEVTSPQAFAELADRGLRVRRPDLTVATMDHSTPTTPLKTNGRAHIGDMMAAAQVRQLEVNCATHGVPLHALGTEGQGIVHVIGPELGLTQPGMTIVCGDSHTSTHGAFGALAFGIGTSEVAHVLATQCLLQRRPLTMEVRIDGTLRPGVTAKDVILAIITRIGVAGGTGHVIEYTGSAIRALDMESRMTICNMSIEAGARAGLIAPDDTTIAYLRDRRHVPNGGEWDAAVTRWRALRSDDGATYDRTVTIHADDIEPMISYGTNPGMCIPIHGRIPDPRDTPDAHERSALEKALRYMALEPGQAIIGKKVDVVFLGSCTNSRISDLRAAARLLDGRHVAPGVRMLVVPGSRAVRAAAEREGLHDVFLAAGAEWREPGCSMCIGMNEDRLKPGEYAVSTSNRNFEGRQGTGGRTLLASPLTAAATAVTGCITDARTLL